MEPPPSQGTKYQVVRGHPRPQPRLLLDRNAAPSLPPDWAWGVTCVQVLQQGPKGHRVDQQADSQEGRLKVWPSTSPLLSLYSLPPLAQGGTSGCLRTMTLLPFHLVSSTLAK